MRYTFKNTSNLIKRSFLPTMLLANLLMFQWVYNAHAQTTDTLRLGFMEYSFANLPLKDAKIAVEIFAQKTLKNGQFLSQTGVTRTITPQIIVLQTREDIKQALYNDEIDLISLSAIDYLLLSPQKLLVPSIVRTNENDNIYTTYVLIAPKVTNWSSLSDFQHAHLRIPKREKLIPIWIDVTLAEAGFPQSTTFFDTIKMDERPIQSLLAVFFKQADACIVSLQTFQTLSQLNPQISQTLTPIVTSPEFIAELMCFHNNFPLADRQAFENASFKLTNTTEGKQILSLFKAKQILKFKPAHIQSLITLFEKYENHYETEPNQK